MPRTQLISSKGVSRILDRLAYQILEKNRGGENLVLFGILSQGALLANVLSARIAAIENRPMRVHALDVTLFRDDIVPPPGYKDLSSPTVEIQDREVILVDDVVFTGRTARAALNAVVRYGRPRSVQLVALIDRGHREYPVQPDFVGRVIPTKHRERVVMDDAEGFAVFLEE